MYMTRFLSQYKSNPEALYLPPEGPNSGYLVIQDEESETYSFFGLYKNKYLLSLPFPQNKALTTRYSSGTGKRKRVSHNEVLFIPVLDQPLSSNLYYAIKPHGSHKGEAFACSKEEDMMSCCLCNCVIDVNPRPLDPYDVYQQFEIIPYETFFKGDGSFYAKSIAEDGYPPNFLRRKGWEIYTKTPTNYELHEAKGIDDALRSRLPEFSFPHSTKTSNSVVVGKWYCPFMFIKEGKLTDQVKTSIFYEIALEQKWERVFEQKHDHNNKGNVVHVKVAFPSEVVFIGEGWREAVWDEGNMVNGVLQFISRGDNNGNEEIVGLNREVFERMRWEEERFGWGGGREKTQKRIESINRKEKFEGIGGWKRFGCYVLVERFVLKRMDGSLVLAYDFYHARHIRTIFD
ncbi:hypothetical protein Lser_V15G11926 [Lactuca serriola]